MAKMQAIITGNELKPTKQGEDQWIITTKGGLQFRTKDFETAAALAIGVTVMFDYRTTEFNGKEYNWINSDSLEFPGAGPVAAPSVAPKPQIAPQPSIDPTIGRITRGNAANSYGALRAGSNISLEQFIADCNRLAQWIESGQ